MTTGASPTPPSAARVAHTPSAAAGVLAAAREGAQFLWGFLRHPRAVGSVVPSSRYLAEAVVAPVSPQARAVAELGPGTGPITRRLLRHLGPQATVLALEIDPAFCALLRREIRDPRLRVAQTPAQQLPVMAAAVGGQVDAVVSGLPFANFPLEMRREIVRAVHAALAPGGVFSGYGYAPFALRAVLREVFGECSTRLVLRNVPPAFVLTARKRDSG